MPLICNGNSALFATVFHLPLPFQLQNHRRSQLLHVPLLRIFLDDRQRLPRDCPGLCRAASSLDQCDDRVLPQAVRHDLVTARLRPCLKPSANRVALTAEVGQNYVALRGAQQRLALARNAVALEQQTLGLARQRFDAGTVSALDVERLRGQLEVNQSGLQPLAAEVDGYRDTLAMLTGREPGALDTTLAASAPIPLPPAEVTVGDPAGLLRRRPDIRAAERMLAASNAEIGTNIARMFPRLTFMGLIGIGGTAPSDLTKLGDFTAIIAPRLQWNFLDFGHNRAVVGEARARRDEAAATYRRIVLSALRDAEGGLDRFAARRAQVAGLARAEQSAGRAATLNAERYRAGTASLIDQLDIERQRLEVANQLAQATVAMTNDYIALQKSLGLGWAEVSAGRPAQ